MSPSNSASESGEAIFKATRTLTASGDAKLLSEEDLFRCLLEKPYTLSGNVSYPTHKSGSIPYDPDKIEIVPLSAFLEKHGRFKGKTEKVPNTLPPVDWRNPIFSESDNRSDLKDKVYLPLSRVLAPRDIAFCQDSYQIHREGTEDSVVVERTTGSVRVVIEEESETLLKTLLQEPNQKFAEFCVTGRSKFLKGRRTETSNPQFACPLILSQLLGYMFSSLVCRGIFATAGRSVFVWIEPVELDDNSSCARKAKKQKVDERKIYVTEELFVEHENFLRAMASFLVESFDIDEEAGVETAKLLNVPSKDGGFKRGGAQKHTPKEKAQDDASDRNRLQGAGESSGNNKESSKKKSAPATCLVTIPRLSSMPNFKVEATLAEKLGRERKGKVIRTNWHGVSAAVKIVDTDVDDREYAVDMFHSEIEAYKRAGAAGLWGKSVPLPLFLSKLTRAVL